MSPPLSTVLLYRNCVGADKPRARRQLKLPSGLAHFKQRRSDFARSLKLSDDFFDAAFIDDSQPVRRNSQTNPTAHAGNPEASILKVRQRPRFRFVICMTHSISYERSLSCYLTYTAHKFSLPARLDDTRQLAAKCFVSKLNARKPKLSKIATRTTGHSAAQNDANLIRITGKLCQFGLSRHSIFHRRVGILDDGLELLASNQIFGRQHLAALILVD